MTRSRCASPTVLCTSSRTLSDEIAPCQNPDVGILTKRRDFDEKRALTAAERVSGLARY
jgi:hypothetical protein